jgi:hypothetical protein
LAAPTGAFRGSAGACPCPLAEIRVLGPSDGSGGAAMA